MRKGIFCIVSFALGVLVALAFYPFSIFPLLISFGAFYFILLKNIDSKLRLFLHGTFFGYGYFCINLYWVPLSIYKAQINLEWLVPILSVIIPIPFALLIGIFAILTRFGRGNSVIYSINFSLLWVIFEYIRSNIFFPFPWALIGHSVTSMLWFSQIISFVGSYGASLLVGLITTSLFSKNKKYIALNLCIFLLICIIGEIRIENNPTISKNDNIKIRLIQPNIQNHHFGNKERQASILEKLSELTLSAGFKDKDYIFWSEAAFPYSIYGHQSNLNMIQDFIPNNKYSALIFGADSIREGHYTSLSFNSILAINKDGKLLGHYDKRILVPFGEYIPYKDKFSFIEKIAYSAKIGDISKGIRSNIIDLGNGIRFLPVICSESVVDKSYLEILDHDSYRFILNITNDAWFGDSLGPYQHFNISRIRAIEYGLPVIRVANAGISGVIDIFGNVLQQTKLNKEAIIDTTIPPKLKEATLFYKIHHFIIPTIFVLYVLMMLYLHVFKMTK